MKHIPRVYWISRITIVMFVISTALPAQDTIGAHWKSVDSVMGRTGTMQPGGVYKYSFPRSDLKVTIDGVVLKPALALGTWVAFRPMSGHTGMDGSVMAMGDLVLIEEEIGPVMTTLQAEGIEQTAVHHHVLRETPRILYMHIEATGDAVKISRAIRTALAKTLTPLTASASSPDEQNSGAPIPIELDTAAISSTLGYLGKSNGGVYQVSVPRSQPIREAGMDIPPAMGTATALNFQPIGNGDAAITGDFVLTAAEVNPVIRTLSEHGIAVTALHNHMLLEEPRLFFMHFWATGNATTLARGLRAALDRTASQPPR